MSMPKFLNEDLYWLIMALAFIGLIFFAAKTKSVKSISNEELKMKYEQQIKK